MSALEDFGQLVGFYINKSKSKFLSKNIEKEEQEEIVKLTQCEAVQTVKYLKVDLTNKNIDIYKNNYIKLWNKIKKDMVRWNSLNLSFLGRIAVIKMNVLPKILYLLQIVPIIKKKEQFKVWHRDIVTFIWVGKKPKIKFKILCDAKERGGLQLPNLELYHEAVCLSWIKDWIIVDNKKLLSIEGAGKIFVWHAYLLYDKVRADPMFSHHYKRNNLLRVWTKYSLYLPSERPLWIIPEEDIQYMPGARRENQSNQDLLDCKGDETIIKSEEDLRGKYSWWNYLQIKNLFNKDNKEYGFRKQETELELILLGDSEKLISKLYKLILNWYAADEHIKECMIKWALNVNAEIELDEWTYFWEKTL